MSEYVDENLKQKIDQYTNGELSPKEVDELWVELVKEEENLEYLKSVANVKAVMEKSRKAGTSAKEHSYIYYAAAAVIALLIAVWAVMNISSQSVKSVSPIADITLEYYRSSEGSPAAGYGNAVIQDAITYANNNNIDKAIRLLEEELSEANKLNTKANLNLTLGALFYNRGKFEKAIGHYSRIISHKGNADLLLLEKAHWYRANAYLQLNQKSDARADIKQAYEYNGAYRRIAERYLKKLSRQ